MNWILAAALLVGAPELPATAMPVDTVVAEVAQALQTGSLIFSQGDCLAVKVYTASRYTHVGCVVVREGEAIVYDSTGGAGVRKLALAAFLASQIDADVSVHSPATGLSQGQAEQFERHLESQLGRPYAIAHHLTGRRGDGLHCAEYAADALAAGGVLSVDQPARLSPASLREAVLARGLHQHLMTVHVEAAELPQLATASWCERLWLDTKHCTGRCYGKLWAWFCCK